MVAKLNAPVDVRQEEEIHGDSTDRNEHREVFAEVSLFNAEIAGSDETGDCSCFSCDGNPGVK